MSEVVRNPAGTGSTEDTWSALPAGQQPEWPDAAELSAVVSELRSYPPLVFAGEADQLKDRIAQDLKQGFYKPGEVVDVLEAAKAQDRHS